MNDERRGLCIQFVDRDPLWAGTPQEDLTEALARSLATLTLKEVRAAFCRDAAGTFVRWVGAKYDACILKQISFGTCAMTIVLTDPFRYEHEAEGLKREAAAVMAVPRIWP